MKNFIVLTGIDETDIALDINNIVTISRTHGTFGNDYTTKEIVKRINDINNKS